LDKFPIEFLNQLRRDGALKQPFFKTPVAGLPWIQSVKKLRVHDLTQNLIKGLIALPYNLIDIEMSFKIL